MAQARATPNSSSYMDSPASSRAVERERAGNAIVGVELRWGGVVCQCCSKLDDACDVVVNCQLGDVGDAHFMRPGQPPVSHGLKSRLSITDAFDAVKIFCSVLSSA